MAYSGSSIDDPVTVVFAGGGSGGHLYPALSVADELKARLPHVRTVFLGTDRPVEQRILDDAHCEFIAQSLKGLSRRPWHWPGMLLDYHRSAQLCRERIEVLDPDIVVGTGGMASVPALREARRRGVPTALLNPDVLPGRANRHLASLVDMVFVQWEDSLAHFPVNSRIEVSGCPVREAFNRTDRSAGISRFGLNPDLKTLLVTGASQGAQTVNEALVTLADELTCSPGWQILHVAGDAHEAAVKEAYNARSIPASVMGYTDHMADAMGAADLVISRAGASTLAELTAVGRASILMPYPYHRDQHQTVNARCLVRAGAARLVTDEIDPESNAASLWNALEPLLAYDEMRATMADAARRIGRGNAATRVADGLLSIIAGRQWAQVRETVDVVSS